MSGSLQKQGSNQPWLGLRMFVIGAVLLIATMVDDDAQTRVRALIIVLWIVTAFVAMLKEALTYGLGDRVTVFAMVLVLAVSITAFLIDRNPYSFVSLSSIVFAGLMLFQAIRNVRKRRQAATVWDGQV